MTAVGSAVPSDVDAQGSMRDRIKDVARDLLIKHGYRGLRFADIASSLAITRASVHYYFGDKSNLADEVIAEYTAQSLREIIDIWRSDEDYVGKILRTIEHNRTRYLRFNQGGVEGTPWSLISRMRLDAALLSPSARQHLRLFSAGVEACVLRSIETAKDRAEFVDSAPVRDIVVQFVSVIDSAGPITQDAGSFARLEHLYLACMRIVVHGYGSETAKRRLGTMLERHRTE